MTPDRNMLITSFLSKNGWKSAARQDLAGDASMRRYDRLCKPTGETAILMDAPPETNPDVRPFVAVARHLSEIELSAPKIYGKDYHNGFLLLEDLGDDIFARILENSPALETQIYTCAVDTLVALHQESPPELVHFGPGMMAGQAGLIFDTWVPALGQPPGRDIPLDFTAAFQDLLHQKTQAVPVMILRDFHAENLLWLPGRTGIARVGLLDFQDALLAHPAYDLVSLLQDVRRDVPARLEQKMITHYIRQTGQDDARFRDAYIVLGVQRNLRILAVFTRLITTLDKPEYARFIPRTWTHLMRGLEHPVLAPLATTLKNILPRPTQANLQRLISK